MQGQKLHVWIAKNERGHGSENTLYTHAWPMTAKRQRVFLVVSVSSEGRSVIQVKTELTGIGVVRRI